VFFFIQLTLFPFTFSTNLKPTKDSLGADNKTLVVVQVSPDADDIQETNCSVTFGARARNVELGTGSASGGVKSAKGVATKQAQVEALVSKANKDKASLESKLSQVEAKCKSLEKALEEEKQTSISALAAVKSSKLEIAQVAESSKKCKSQAETANKRTEYELRIAMDKLEKTEKENVQILEEKKKAESRMKKMEEELSQLKAAVKKSVKKTSSLPVVSASQDTTTTSAPDVAQTESKSECEVEPSEEAEETMMDNTPSEPTFAPSLPAVQESQPATFAQVAASPPKKVIVDAMENQENISSLSVTPNKTKAPKQRSKKVSFLSPCRSPLAARNEENIVDQKEGKFRTTPHKEKPSLQEATISSMKSSMSISAPLQTNAVTPAPAASTISTGGATRITVVESKKGLSKGAQRVSFSGNGGARRQSVSTGNRWH